MAGLGNATCMLDAIKKKADDFMNSAELKQRYNSGKTAIKSSDAVTLNIIMIEELINQIRKKDADEKAELKVELKIRDDEIANLKKVVINKSFEVEKLQQYINRDVVKICGVKEPIGLGPNEFEDTNKTVKTVLGAANIPITDQDISISHRLPTREQQRNGKPSSLLLKTSRRDIRNMIIRQKKDMRENQDFKTNYPDVFIVEHLTPLRSKVAYLLRNDEAIEKCWTIDGRIKVKKVGADSKSAPITIDSLANLTKAGWSQQMVDDLILQG